MAEDSSEHQAIQSDSEESEQECPAGAPAWMATYGDMVTLLFAFFVLLFAMGSPEKVKFIKLMESLRSALGVEEIPQAGTQMGLKLPDEVKETDEPNPIDALGKMVQNEVEEIVKELEEFVALHNLAGKVEVKTDETGVTIQIQDVLLFPVGEDQITAPGLEVLKSVYQIIREFKYPIMVIGHTDNSPINTVEFQSNWELSVNRACEVVRFLISQGTDPKLIAAMGYAEYRPVAPNSTPEGRSKNRRVEIKYERQKIAEAISRKQPKTNSLF